MSGHCILGVCVSIVLLYSTECTVTVTMVSGDFLCSSTSKLKCAISPYRGGMTWKLDGTIITQCAFGSCNALGALPTGDVFTYDEAAGEFFLDIGITHADNGTMYQCDDGSNQDQITVNIIVPPHTGTPITVSGTTLSATAGCFYPASNGRMDIYCVTDFNEVLVNTVPMIPTCKGCTGDCAGPGIFQAAGSATIDNSTGTSAYRVKVYLDGYESNAYTCGDTSPIYTCDGGGYNNSFKEGTSNTASVIGYSVGATFGCFLLVLLSVYLVWRFRAKRAHDNNQDDTSRNDRAASEDPAVVNTHYYESVSDAQIPNLSTIDGVYNTERSVSNYEALKMANRDSNYSVLVASTSDRLHNKDEYENMKL